VQAQRGPGGIEYRFHVRASEVSAPETKQQQSFTDEAEGQSYLQAELTRLVAEGWQRARPELGE
ncbi:MAG TPA: hypothetical protein VMF13_07020, partial [Luteitalea sp.]|nr:hypothetical protein [Luteitalea sp.]